MLTRLITRARIVIYDNTHWNEKSSRLPTGAHSCGIYRSQVIGLENEDFPQNGLGTWLYAVEEVANVPITAIIDVDRYSLNVASSWCPFVPPTPYAANAMTAAMNIRKLPKHGNHSQSLRCFSLLYPGAHHIQNKYPVHANSSIQVNIQTHQLVLSD